jgi:hypothetical protein
MVNDMKLKLRFFYICSGTYFHEEMDRPDCRINAEIIGSMPSHSHPYTKYLASALQSDFPSPAYCEKVLENISKVNRGELPKTDWAGNAFVTEIYFDRVQIEHQQFAGDPEWPMWSCSLAEFETALKAWKRFLEMPVSADSEVIVELPTAAPGSVPHT